MKKNEFKKYVTVLSIAIIVICVACLISVVALIVNGAKSDILFNNSQVNENLSHQETSCRLGKTPDYGQNYIDRLIFVGDASIYHLSGSRALDADIAHLQMWTGVDNSLPLDFNIDISDIIYPETGEGMTISEAAATKKPEFIIITLGIENGVAYCGKDRFITYYSKLIDSLKESSPTTKIILQSIFPVSEEYEKSNPSVTNYKIDRANSWIEELASEKELRYIDTASVLKDANGYLDKKYDRGDGLRLNNEGYLEVVKYIRTHGYK